MVEPVSAAIAVSTAATRTNKILTEMNGRVKTIQRQIEDASPAFKGMKDILERQYKLVMKPVGDIMQLLMRPFLIRMLQNLRAGMTDISKVRGEITSGAISEEKGLAKIAEITKNMSEDFYEVSQEMNQVIGPTISNLGGFQKGMELVTNTWVLNWTNWVSGFGESLVTNLDKFDVLLSDDLTGASSTLALQLIAGVGGWIKNIISNLEHTTPSGKHFRIGEGELYFRENITQEDLDYATEMALKVTGVI